MRGSFKVYQTAKELTSTSINSILRTPMLHDDYDALHNERMLIIRFQT